MKSKMRWGECMTLEFVKLFAKYECLWNPANDGYKSKVIRQNAHKSIAAEFEMSTGKSLNVQEVKVKIKNLRTTYIQEVHKIIRKSRPDAMVESSLVWFNEMDRCMKLVPNIVSSNLRNSYKVDLDNSEQTWDHPETEIDVHEDQPDPLVTRSEDETVKDELTHARMIDPQDLITECKPSSTMSLHNKIKKKRMKHRRLYPLQGEIGRSTAQEDEFDIYGKYIAAQLRSMGLQKALRVQLKIQRFVSEARVSEDMDSD